MASVLAAQLYTLRDFLKTPAEAAATLRRVKQIGYDAVQVSGTPVPAVEIARILEGEGLTCCATHQPLDRLRERPQEVMRDHELLKCELTALGGWFPKTATAADWERFGDELNRIAEKYSGGKLRLGYHNHSHELVRYGTTTALEILLKWLDPRVWFEIDTYWIQHGGSEPALWIRKVGGRIPVVHLKDMGITLDRVQYMAEVGEGNLNWPAILGACREAGVKWYAIEQDVCPGDPFESLTRSLRNARGMGLE